MAQSELPAYKVSAFEEPALSFTLNLPGTAAYGPSGARDLGRVEGLLDYTCGIVNAHRQSVIEGDLLQELRRVGRDLSELLHMAVEGNLNNPSDEFLGNIRARFEAGTQWDRPRLERARGGVTFRYNANIESFDGLYALLVVLLMHPKYRQLIRRCPQCGKFFMRTGKRLFCTPRCARAANDAGVLKRQKNQRMRRAAQELLSHVASRDKRAAAVRQAFRAHPDVETPEQLAARAQALLQLSRKHK